MDKNFKMIYSSTLKYLTIFIPILLCNAFHTQYTFFHQQQQQNDRNNKHNTQYLHEKYNVHISNRYHYEHSTCTSINNQNDDNILPDPNMNMNMNMYTFTNMTKRTVILTKPMGILLEEDFEKAPGIVTIAKIDPNGNTAQVASNLDIAIGDILLNVNGYKASIINSISNKPHNDTFSSLEEVMDIIIQSSFVKQNNDIHHKTDIMIDKSNQIQLELGRIHENDIIVRFSNGIQIATKSGTKLSSLAYKALMPISYSCDSGGCGTCEQIMRVQKYQNHTSNEFQFEDRYVRPCIARVPKGSKIISLFPSDRFQPDTN